MAALLKTCQQPASLKNSGTLITKERKRKGQKDWREREREGTKNRALCFLSAVAALIARVKEIRVLRSGLARLQGFDLCPMKERK